MSLTSQAVASSTATRHHRIGVVGPAGVGKTTVASLVADHLRSRHALTVRGEAAGVVADSATGGPRDGLGLEWTVVDCPAGTDALTGAAPDLDAVLIVATPDSLESARAYGEVATDHDLPASLVVSQFTDADRERVRAFDHMERAGYIYSDEGIETALADGSVPPLEDRTIEAVPLETLAAPRLEPHRARDALDDGAEPVVDVVVESHTAADRLLEAFRGAGYPASYFACNCRGHEGHVVARTATR